MGLDAVIGTILAVCAAGVVWVYFGYPLALLAVGLARPRPRRRAPVELPVSVVIAAHDEGSVIGEKIADVRNTSYPEELVEVLVSSDGSSDATVTRARAAGADAVLDLPRVGKIAALEAAVEVAQGDVLVFTDADARWLPDSLPQLMCGFADESVGCVSCAEVSEVPNGAGTEVVGRGEGLYWRYEHLVKRLEDRVGSTVSASGRLYGIRRELFEPGYSRASADDVAISTKVLLEGRRLAFEPSALVFVDGPQRGDQELRRKVRVMNGGLRGVLNLGRLLNPLRGGGIAIQILTHKILRRLVPFLLLGVLATSAWLTARQPAGWLLLAPQLAFYALAAVGWAGRRRIWGRAKPLYVAYYFCLVNLAAALAVLSLVGGVRFESWKPRRR